MDEGYERDEEGYERLRVSLGSIEPDPENVMVHDDEDLGQKELLLGEFGQMQDLVVRPHPKREGMYMLVAGEGRWRAMGRMGWEACWVRVAKDWTEVKAHSFMLADNLRADPDDRKLVLMQSKLEDEGVDLSLVGTDAEELEAMRRMLDMGGEEERRGARGRAVTAKQQAQHVTVVLYMPQVDVLEQAIRKTGKRNRGEGLLAVCEAFLKSDYMPEDVKIEAMEGGFFDGEDWA